MALIPVNPQASDRTVATIPNVAAASAQKLCCATPICCCPRRCCSAPPARARRWRSTLPYPGVLITMVGYFGLLFAVMRLRNSGWGVLLVFALTGFMGYTLGPILNLYMRAIPNGGSTIMTAVGMTGATFLALSAYAVMSKRDFSFMRNFLFIGVFTAFLLGLAAMFMHLPGLSLAVSGMFVLLSSGLILWQTGEIVNGGETNYISATVTLYVQIFNLFMSLLRLLSARN